MKYLYYPGCSLEGTAKEYDSATRALMQALGVELIELADWTCCGATAAHGVSSLLSLALPARNLALAQQQHPDLPVLVPCSACYLNLKKVAAKIRSQPGLLKAINQVLAEDNLTLNTEMSVRHLLDVLVNDVGPDQLAGRITRPLTGLTIAPYYGCQCLRPYAVFDDPEEPHSMEGLIQAAGARVFQWAMGPKCCGASQMNTHMDTALELTGAILQAAQGADAVATVCPMCQMNLEGYQKRLSHLKGASFDTTILYLPQLLGLALGIEEELLKMGLNLSVTGRFQANLKHCRPLEAAAV